MKAPDSFSPTVSPVCFLDRGKIHLNIAKNSGRLNTFRPPPRCLFGPEAHGPVDGRALADFGFSSHRSSSKIRSICRFATAFLPVHHDEIVRRSRLTQLCWHVNRGRSLLYLAQKTRALLLA